MPLSSSTVPTDPLTGRIAASLRDRNRLSAELCPRIQEVQASIYHVLLDRVGDVLEGVAE